MEEIKYYFDIGSSTIKMYDYIKKLELIEEKSIIFKKDFCEGKISNNNIKEFLEFIDFLKEKYNLNTNNTNIYATGIWRKITDKQLEEIKTQFIKRNLKFNVISHEKENYYLQKAMNGNYNKKRVLIVNMGGKTTELIVFFDDKIENKVNLDIGVADVLTKFPNINDNPTNIKKEEIIDYIFQKIGEINTNLNCEIGIHTGGELRFQKLVKYNLKENTFFDDGVHELFVTYEDFVKKNEELLYSISLKELYKLMPKNPKWMDGAKAGCILGEAIFKKANVKYVIPSDLNLIHGVIKSMEDEM